MLTLFLNFQKLLSISTGSSNTKKAFKLPYLTIFFSIILIFALSLIFGEEGLLFYPFLITLYSVYSIINSQNRLFEIVPVSKLYSLTNIYLYVFITTLIITVITAVFLVLIYFPLVIGTVHLLNLFTMGRVIGIPLNELITNIISNLNIGLLLNYWKPLLITFCMSVIIVCILLPIFFINLSPLRKKLTTSVTVLVPVVLLFFKNTLPVVTKLGKVDFWKSINLMINYNEFLLILISLCIVILPVSVFISYRLYKGKRCLTC